MIQKFLLLCLTVVMPMLAVAQTDRATMTGTISDSTGSRIAHAIVALRNVATTNEQTTQTNTAGVYTLAALPVGDYTASISAPGFATVHIEKFQLNVGETHTFDLAMHLAAVVSQVEVVTAGSDFDRSTAEIGGVVHGSQIRELPINGRNWVSLMTLTPGVIDSGTGTEDQMRFAGMSSEDNVYHLDGSDMSGINHAYLKNNMRLQVSTEAIAEFQANAAAYSADQGSAPGGQMELVSRSGGAQFHGAAWEFIRNSAFDAAPWYYTSIPLLRLNNFGANLGGPIWKRKKLFFFANWESIRQVLNQQINGYVPSASFRAAVLATSPQMAPILDAYPTSTLPGKDANSSEWFGSARQVVNEDSGLIRADYQITSRTSFYGRYNTDHYRTTAPGNLTEIDYTTITTPNILLGMQHAFTPHLLNDFKFGFNRDAFVQGQDTALPIAVSIGGTALTSLNNPSGSVRFDNSFNTVDDATYVKGKHTIKYGVYFRRIQENKASPNSPNQSISFTGYSHFESDIIDTDSYAGTVPLTGQRATQSFGYVLDQYQMRPNLTLNFGLRYEYYGVDHEVNGRGVVVDPLNCPAVTCSAGSEWYAPNLTDFEPRLSIQWSPEILHGKTVVRTGFGIYDGSGQFGGLGTPVANVNAISYSLTQQNAPGLSYPLSTYNGSVTDSYSPAASPINRKDVQVDEWTLSVQQEVAKQTIAQASYFGTSVSHAFSDWTLNGINPTTGTRPYAGYSTLDYRSTSNHGSTNALQLGLRRNMSTGLLVSASYELSHSIDNGGIGGGEADVPQNLACLSCERGPSDEDMRHYFSASTVWQLPVGRDRALFGNSSRLVDGLLGQWQLSGIADARSGLPMNITISRSTSALPDQLNKNQRPNLVPGVSIYPHHKTTSNWLNAAAFAAPANGTWGDSGRNLARAPGVWQIDPALNKRIALNERVGLSFRAEAFNVLNRAQYGAPAHTWGASTYGLITSSANTTPTGTGGPREIQFMMKLDY
jgi:hypothetical protein